jgi:glutathione S-transferase
MSYVLYTHPLASYCQKVTIAFAELDVPYQAKLVDLGDPDELRAFKALWPTAKIPLLVDSSEGTVVPETSIIIEYIDRHARGGGKLFGQNDAAPKAGKLDAGLQARLWDRVVDGYLMAPMQQIVADKLRPEDRRDPFGTSQAYDLIASTYRMLDDRLATSPWLAGEHFSLADCGAAPSLFYANTLAPLDAQTPHLQRYFERLFERDSVQKAVAEARPYFKFYPYAERIPSRFL